MAQLARLDTLAEQINQEHRRAKAAFGKTLQHAKRAGGLLVEAKERTPYGQWLRWLEENFEFTNRTAENYMKIYTRWPEIEGNSKQISNFTEALKALAPLPATATTQDQATAISRDRGVGPPRWPSVELREEPTEEDREPGVEAGEEPTEPREQPKEERSEDKDD